MCDVAPRLAAAANGPGVGGTNVCVVYNPEASANESCAELVDDEANAGINRDKIINPESQKTGIPTSTPITDIANNVRDGPKAPDLLQQ
jgi:hypothetical protein